MITNFASATFQSEITIFNCEKYFVCPAGCFHVLRSQDKEIDDAVNIIVA